MLLTGSHGISGVRDNYGEKRENEVKHALYEKIKRYVGNRRYPLNDTEIQ